ncbi:hypothetical protein RDABS01_036575 [Bienertia sinuspersici]
MARNKPPKPLTEAPPEPDSSDDDQNSASSSSEDEEEQEQPQDDEASSSSDSSDEEPPLQSPKKPQITTPNKTINNSSDEEEEDDESPGPSSKPRSKPNVVTLSAEKEKEKRPLEIDEKEKEKGVSSKKPRKEKEKSAIVVHEEGSKKQASVPFQRLYSEDDEIAILEGMIEYKKKKAADPMIDVDDLYGFIKKSLHVDVNRSQFVDKIRRLKKRYYNAKKKKLTNPHEIKSFDLSKQIWGEYAVNDADDNKASNGVIENSNVGAKSKTKPRTVKIKSVGNGGVVEEQKTKVEEESEKGLKSLKCDEKDVIDMEVSEDASKERLRKKGLRLMGAKARAELLDMWDKVVVAQREVDEMRFNVLKEENRRILEALKSGKM